MLLAPSPSAGSSRWCRSWDWRRPCRAAPRPRRACRPRPCAPGARPWRAPCRRSSPRSACGSGTARARSACRRRRSKLPGGVVHLDRVAVVDHLERRRLVVELDRRQVRRLGAADVDRRLQLAELAGGELLVELRPLRGPPWPPYDQCLPSAWANDALPAATTRNGMSITLIAFIAEPLELLTAATRWRQSTGQTAAALNFLLLPPAATKSTLILAPGFSFDRS